MTQDQLIKDVFQLAKAKGFTAYELYFETSKDLELQSFEEEIVKYASSVTGGVNFRGIYQGKLGSCFSEIIDDETAHMLVSQALEAAKAIEVEDEVFIYDQKEDYQTLSLVDKSLSGHTNEEKIDLVLKNEVLASKLEGIDKVSGSYYGEGYTLCRMVNAHGLDVQFDRNQAYAYIGLVASDGQDKVTAYAFDVNNDFLALKESPLVLEAAKKVNDKKGAIQVPTQEYPVVFSHEAASHLLGAYLSMFSAEVAQKGMSLLKDKVDTAIASPLITLYDDPHLDKGMASRPFDGEGVATFKKALIEEGVLKTLLHNLKTAKKAGVKTTANASRASYQSTIGVAFTNAYIKPSQTPESALIKQANEGVYITELDGLHAGTNAITGEFSLGARGFKISKGLLDHPVKKIVISGNFLDVLKSVSGVADTLKFTTEPVASPALLVDSLSIAGA